MPGPFQGRTAVALAAVLGAASVPGVGAAAQGTPPPALVFHKDRRDPAFGSLDLVGLSERSLEDLRRASPSPDQLAALFRVVVVSGAAPDGGMPAVAGRIDLLADRIRFSPLYPPDPGVPYRAEVDLAPVLGPAAPRLPPLIDTVDQPPHPRAAYVTGVYPSAPVVPANLLRIYLVFSQPMQRGRALDHIRLLDADGHPDAAAFYRSPVELWDPSMRRLTLLLDPGRVKREVGPNRELGAPLQSRRRYRLVIGQDMTDATGHTLRAGYSKTFRVSQAVRTAIDPRRWAIRRPLAGTREALGVTSPIALDRALMAREIRITAPDGGTVAGHVRVDRQEHRWSIHPQTPWIAGDYCLQVGPSLEDVSGNTVDAPFDAEAVDPARRPWAEPLRMSVTIAGRSSRGRHPAARLDCAPHADPIISQGGESLRPPG